MPIYAYEVLALIIVAAVQLQDGVDSWAGYAKFLIGLVVGLLVLSGGLFSIAWFVVSRARIHGFKFLDEWAASDKFRHAVDASRQDTAVRHRLEISLEIDQKIAEHNGRDSPDAHAYTIRHALNNILAGSLAQSQLSADINMLIGRVSKLESSCGVKRRDE